MRPILAYSNSARPLRGDEGQVFINVTTQEKFIIRDGYWRPLVDATPSTPEQVLSEPSTPKEEAEPEKPTPKKKTTKKKSTKKEEK